MVAASTSSSIRMEQQPRGFIVPNTRSPGVHTMRPVNTANMGEGLTHYNNKQRMHVMVCVLVTCKRLQVVTSAFRPAGHEAYSCDTRSRAATMPHTRRRDHSSPHEGSL